jgi:nitrite reductase/ring-hydroxylating ferredoxin subunit/uncharacterized membrane protein
MSLDLVRSITGSISRSIDSQGPLLDSWAKGVQSPLASWVRSTALGQTLKDFLHGVWLGHSLHPALTDLPIGAWSAGVLFDLVGIEDGADASFALGSLAAVPTAMAGTADWFEITDEPRRLGFVHAVLNSAGLIFIVLSLAARGKGRRGLGILLSTTGYTLSVISAWIGGELVFVLGTGVSHNAFEPTATEFTVAAEAASLQDGVLTSGKIEVEGQPIPLVLLKRGQEVLALSAICSHAGGPLPEGKLLDYDRVECPWHRSQFSLRDGSVRHGPASVPQPAYEARIRAGKVEVRRIS